jgi:hypothetical protein
LHYGPVFQEIGILIGLYGCIAHQFLLNFDGHALALSLGLVSIDTSSIDFVIILCPIWTKHAKPNEEENGLSQFNFGGQPNPFWDLFHQENLPKVVKQSCRGEGAG